VSTADKPEAAATSLTERIRVAVEDDIVGGRLAPGETIDDMALAAAFGVSRTPVREALLLLSAQGLVDIVPRAAVRVRRPSAAELVALLEALAELEAVCARLAAQRMSASDRETLQKLHDRAAARAAAGDRTGYERANAGFHEAIYRGCGNPVVLEHLQATRKRLAAFRRRVMDQPGRLLAASCEHGLIVDAVLQGEADAAGQAMREHILRKGHAVADLVLVHG
jgi:DNA-binding GntR family transcriptional regulator